MKEKFITIPNLSDYVAFHYRTNPWLKMYYDLPQNYAFSQLTNSERWLYIGLILLAGRSKNAIAYDLVYLKRTISNGKFSEISLKKMEKLELIAIKPLAECYPVANTKREEEKRKDKKRTNTFSSNKKPFYEGRELRKKDDGKWYVIPKEGGSWLEYTDSKDKIIWK